MSQTPPTDERPEAELYREISRAGWNLGRTVRTRHGVTLTFRKHYTAFLPGVETREVAGKDPREAMQKFLAELEGNEAG
jgi:hypothetical protein